MSISSINSIDTNIYNEKIKAAANPAEANTLFYGDFGDLKGDSAEFSSVSSKSETSTLRDEFNSVKEEQRLIGKVWDGIKNFFNMKTGSDNIEDTITKYENGEISEQEAKSALENYKNGQKMCVDVAADITSGIIAVGAAALAPVTGGASLLVAAGAGAVSKTAIKASDALLAGREYELKDLGYDLITGSVNGAIAPLSNALGGAAGTGVAKACGLNVVNGAAKTTGKGMIANLLARQGASYVAKEGTKLSAGVIGAKVLSYGADMAVDGALSGAADGFSRALGEGRIDDIKDETLNGALGGLIAAPVIGGSMRLAFRGASSLGSKMFHSAGETLSDTASDGTARKITSSFDTDDLARQTTKETSAFGENPVIFESVQDALDYMKKSENPKIKEILKSYNDRIEKGKKVPLQRLQDALNLVENPAYDERLKLFSSSLAQQYADDVSMRKTQRELLDILGVSDDMVYNPEKKIYTLESEYGKISARSKGKDSVAPKIRNKVLGLKEDFPLDETAASSMIGDAHGMRIVAADSVLSEEKLSGIIRANVSDDSEYELFMRYITKGEGKIEKSMLPKLRSIEKQVYDKAREVQSGKFTENLAKALEEDKIRITELHNYAGRDGIAYFSDIQTDRLKSAYETWYNKMLKIAQESPETSNYKIIEKDGLTCLQDCKGYVFEPKMLIESVSNSKDAIKGTGYTAAQMNIITKDGVQEELQYRGTGTDKLAELEHVPYDIKKNKDSVQRPEYDFLRSIFGKYKNDDDFDKLYNQYLSDTYKTTRRAELGFFGTVPDISDYLGDKLTPDELDAISFEGLRKLHNYTKKLVDKQNAA